MDSNYPEFSEGDSVLIAGGSGEPGIIARSFYEDWDVIEKGDFVSSEGLIKHLKEKFPGSKKGKLHITTADHCKNNCLDYLEYDWVFEVVRKTSGSFGPELVGGKKYSSSMNQ